MPRGRVQRSQSGGPFDSCRYMGTPHDTDEALLLSGDLEDFGLFYDRYVRALLAFFQRRTRTPRSPPT